MRPDTAAAYDDYKRVPQLGQAVVGEEDAVPRELLEDELVVVVARLCPPGERLVAQIFLIKRDRLVAADGLSHARSASGCW